jgi:LysR family transcriptional regulator, chromosome initiation inhibitor
MKVLRLEWLLSIEAISKTGSFSKAAISLGISQSAISQRIKELEHAIRRPLIVRNKPLVLTPSGTVVCRYAQRYAELSQKAHDELINALPRGSFARTEQEKLNCYQRN